MLPPPSSSAARFGNSRAWPSPVRSPGRTAALRPASSIRARTASASGCSSGRYEIATSAPSCAQAIATARPIPESPSVISARRCRSPFRSSSVLHPARRGRASPGAARRPRFRPARRRRTPRGWRRSRRAGAVALAEGGVTRHPQRQEELGACPSDRRSTLTRRSPRRAASVMPSAPKTSSPSHSPPVMRRNVLDAADTIVPRSSRTTRSRAASTRVAASTSPAKRRSCAAIASEAASAPVAASRGVAWMRRRASNRLDA